MLVNKDTVISTSSVTLVPYEKCHVPTYHEWLQDEQIQKETASEPLSLDEEYAMQASWRSDHDKLTFIACKPSSRSSTPEENYDSPDQMIGDVNLFLSPSDEDPEGCIGELELMIAPTSSRRHGYGRATILSFMHYISLHLPEILTEYKTKIGVAKMRLSQLRVKIGSTNEKSIRLFESIGFIKVEESPNYFGEFELVLEGFVGEQRTVGLMEKFGVKGYEELRYRGSES